MPKLQENLAAIEARMAAPDFWSNRERAQGDVEEVSRLRSLINPFQQLEREIEDFERAATAGCGRNRSDASHAGGERSVGRTRPPGPQP